MTNPLQRLKDILAHRHVKAAASVASDVALTGMKKVQAVGADALDTITRKSTDDEVREHILQQGKYNDAFANKLDEVLRRIDILEKQVNKG